MLVGFLALLAGCDGKTGSTEMGETCSSSEQCLEGGSCLKGVCSGYACTSDADCSVDHVCGVIGGVDVCALPCEAVDSEECPGLMNCQVFEGADTGSTALYCL